MANNFSLKPVELGFAEDVKDDDIPLSCKIIPCKIGGKPSWLELENIPTREEMQCKQCGDPCIFLCQIYAPDEDRDDCFHRTIFVFICRNEGCCRTNESTNILVFRCQLPQENKFYPADISVLSEYDVDEKYLKKYCQTPENFNVRLCNLCGCRGPLQCARCKLVTYCSKEHQKLDWTERHKKECTQETQLSKKTDTNSTHLFPKFELALEPEDEHRIGGIEVEEEDGDEDDSDEDEDDRKKQANEKRKMKEFDELLKKQLAATGEEKNFKENELEQYALTEKDPQFNFFRKRTEIYPDQVLRYDKGGEPLWITSKNKIDFTQVPNCENCGGKRIFEFQIMPQLLYTLKENKIDFGVLLVYICENNCDLKGKYFREFVYKQDLVKDLDD